MNVCIEDFHSRLESSCTNVVYLSSSCMSWDATWIKKCSPSTRPELKLVDKVACHWCRLVSTQTIWPCPNKLMKIVCRENVNMLRLNSAFFDMAFCCAIFHVPSHTTSVRWNTFSVLDTSISSHSYSNCFIVIFYIYCVTTCHTVCHSMCDIHLSQHPAVISNYLKYFYINLIRRFKCWHFCTPSHLKMSFVFLCHKLMYVFVPYKSRL